MYAIEKTALCSYNTAFWRQKRGLDCWEDCNKSARLTSDVGLQKVKFPSYSLSLSLRFLDKYFRGHTFIIIISKKVKAKLPNLYINRDLSYFKHYNYF